MAKSRQYKWRFYADNNVERKIVEHLRRSGFDLLWIAEDPELKRQQDDAFHYQRAKRLGRYLLTRDLDFWDDHAYPLLQSPGVVIIATKDVSVAKYLPVLVRKVISDNNPLAEPLHLDGLKIKVEADGFVLKGIDQEAQTVTNERWLWSDLL